MATLTVSHRAGQRLKSVWDAVSTGWNAVTAGRVWRRNAATFGVEGWVRFIEVKVGDNGWHVHAHVLLFLHHGLGAVQRADLTRSMLGRWRTGIGKHGFSASVQHGCDVRMIHGADAAKTLADYFNKGAYQADGSAPAVAAVELTRGDLKRGGTSRTPFQVLEDFLDAGDVEDLETWREWERGSKGRRQMSWSKGFREMVRVLGPELSDHDIAGEELGTAADDVMVLPKATWVAIRADGNVLLDLVDVEGIAAGKRLLAGLGLAWFEPGER